MAMYRCNVCNVFEYDSEVGSPEGNISPGTTPDELDDDWRCPVCRSDRTHLQKQPGVTDESVQEEVREFTEEDPGARLCREPVFIEPHFVEIKTMAGTGRPIIEPMRSANLRVSWDEVLILAAGLARLPRNPDEPVSLRTIIGPKAKQPMELRLPFFVTHMSFGALSREAKVALAKGSAAAGTAIGSGEGGVLDEEKEHAYRYIFEYIPNRYSLTDEYLRTSDAVEIKISQSAKPGMGGMLPGSKATPEIARIRGFPVGHDIHSPARFPDISTPDDLRVKIGELRDRSGGRPVGVKFAAGDIEGDLEVALSAEPDFITIDGRPGGTAAAPKSVKDATSVPSVYAVDRARRYFDEHGVEGISLIVTGGYRISSDIAKALALGADAVALGTAAMIAAGCDQYRLCHTGQCPTGVTTQDPALRERLDIDTGARGVENFFHATGEELEMFCRLCGHSDIHDLTVDDLCTTHSEISAYTRIRHV